MNLQNALYRLRWNLAPFWVQLFPCHVDIELSNRCNLKCGHCPQSVSDFEKGDMPYDMAQEILNQARGKAASIKFSWRGEALLNKDFGDIVSYARLLGFADLMLNTNGMVWSDALAKLTTVAFSIDSLNGAYFAEIRPGGNLETVLQHLFRLKRLAPKMRIIVNFRVQEKNKDETEAFEDFCLHHGFIPCVKPATWRTEAIAKPEGLARRNCGHPFRRLTVAYDGEIFPCCAAGWRGSDLSLGNIKNISLKEAWNCDKIKDIRRRQRDISRWGLKYDDCYNCYSGDAYHL